MACAPVWLLQKLRIWAWLATSVKAGAWPREKVCRDPSMVVSRSQGGESDLSARSLSELSGGNMLDLASPPPLKMIVRGLVPCNLRDDS